MEGAPARAANAPAAPAAGEGAGAAFAAAFAAVFAATVFAFFFSGCGSTSETASPARGEGVDFKAWISVSPISPSFVSPAFPQGRDARRGGWDAPAPAANAPSPALLLQCSFQCSFSSAPAPAAGEGTGNAFDDAVLAFAFAGGRGCTAERAAVGCVKPPHACE